MIDNLKERFSALEGVEVELTDPVATATHVDAVAPADKIRELVQIVRDKEFMVESVTAVDATPQMMVVYHFSHPDTFCRVTARVLIDREAPKCPTISDIFPGANWHERETDDFYGIDFIDHPDKTPLILPEDAGDQNPLLKEGKRLKELGKVFPRFAAPEPEADTETSTESEG